MASFVSDLEDQEVPSATDKRQLDEDKLLQLTSPHQKRISLIHHVPIEEAVENEDLKVHVPGGAIEDIVIHTEVAPPTPRLSMEHDPSTMITVSHLCLRTSRVYFCPSVDPNGNIGT